jgi:hypothetical protein
VADDFNGDGRLDLLSINQFDVTLLPGLAPGEFGPPAAVASGANFSGGINAGSYSTRDFNRDGRPDLALLVLDSSGGFSQSRIKVFINNGSGVFSAASDTLVPFNTGVVRPTATRPRRTWRARCPSSEWASSCPTHSR